MKINKNDIIIRKASIWQNSDSTDLAGIFFNRDLNRRKHVKSSAALDDEKPI